MERAPSPTVSSLAAAPAAGVAEGGPGPGAEGRTGLADARALYAHAVRARLLSARMTLLQHAGGVAFHAACIGEEVAIAATAMALREQDWFFPGHREWAGALVRGISTEAYAHQAFGSARDAAKGHGTPDHPSSKACHVVPASGLVGAHLVQAVGAAWAAKMRKDDVVTLAMFGTAAAATGDFHNAVNFAGVFKAPCVLVSRDSRPGEQKVSLADRAAAYGVACASVDGGDALAVLALVREAVARAAEGKGATLVEIATQRFTSLPNEWGAVELLSLDPGGADPLARLRAVLARDGGLDASAHDALVAEIRAEIDAAIAAAEGAARPAFASVFEDVYAEVPAHLRAQAEEATS
jgi:TPP-dependent pyruvate/acetoin dehydrogenase alpha subunit